jgi:hypothetical protein
LADGPLAVRARAATGDERVRLWTKFRDFPGWGGDIDALAARRPTETAVVVFEPVEDQRRAAPASERPSRHEALAADATPAAQAMAPAAGGRRLRLRHRWLVPGLAISVYAGGQANLFGLGIVPLLVFTIVPDLPRLLGIGQPRVHGRMPGRAVPLFNLLHHPLPPLAMLGLALAGVLPPLWLVGSIAWARPSRDRTRHRRSAANERWPASLALARRLRPGVRAALGACG